MTTKVSPYNIKQELYKAAKAIKLSRMQNIRLLIIIVAICLPVFMLMLLSGVLVKFVMYCHENNKLDFIAFIAVCISCLIYWPFMKYKQQAKNILMPFVCENLKEYEIKYYKDEKTVPIEFRRSYLHYSTTETLYGGDRFLLKFDDIFAGVYENTTFMLADIRATIKGYRRRKTSFQGVSVYIPYTNENISNVIVRRRSAEKPNKSQRIKLEDVRFEKYFDAYGDDQILARKLLTPRMIENIIRLAAIINNIKGPIRPEQLPEFIVTKKGMAIFIRSSEDAYEYNKGLFGKVDDLTGALEKIISEVKQTVAIIKACQKVELLDKIC